jgi:hypothetical protein
LLQKVIWILTNPIILIILKAVVEGLSCRGTESLAHKSITMTMHYAHHYPESLRESVEVLDSYCNSATDVAESVDPEPKNL